VIEPLPVLEGRGMAVSLDGRWIIDTMDIAFRQGEFAVIIGPNGAGKTTLIRALAGLLPAWGKVSVGGVGFEQLDPRTRARAIAYLPQGHVFHWPLPVVDVVALGRLPHGAGAGSLSVADREAVDEAMAMTDVMPLAERAVTSLSGGERARVALARVLAVEAPVILADEPTASLDPRYQLVVLETLRRQVDAGVSVVAILHDLSMAARFADRILVMQGGKVVGDGPPSSVLQPPLLASVFGIEAAVIERDGVRLIVPWAATALPEG
jgi:iron complex transport system ATP-binding protein